MVENTSLVAAYNCNETSGSTCNDAYSTNDMTISGATVNQTGKIDKCYNYDGSNDYKRLCIFHKPFRYPASVGQ